MILSTDIANHYNLIMAFKGRLSTKKFPEENNSDDKQLLMSIVLYASDHAAPTKNSITYFKWMDNQMEEFYQ
jgi:hypothetical protein